MEWSALLIPAAIAFLVSLAGTRVLVGVLTARQVLDQPNERSSHVVPTPRGGGIAVTCAVVIALLYHGWGSPLAAMTPPAVVLGGAVVLGLISFLDDLRGLSAAVRLAAHLLAIIAALRFGGLEHGLFADWLPSALDWTLTGFLWLWFVNLFNFMDGIDGISGVETVSIAVGAAGLVLLGLLPESDVTLALVLAAAALGFLVWNWSPARIFLGDTGSVPLGFLLGWLLLSSAQGSAAGSGLWVALAILPAYYLTDATVTLLRRLARGEKVWKPHREHYYQQAVIRGHGHARVCVMILLANAGLIATAWWLAPDSALLGAAMAGIVVTILIGWLRNAEPMTASTEDDQ